MEIEQEKKYRRMQEYYYGEFLTHYLNQERDTEIRIEEIKKHINREKRKQSKNYKTYMELTQYLGKIIRRSEELVEEEIKPVLPKLIDKDQKQRYNLWKNANIRDEIFHPDIYNSLKKESDYFAKYLRDKVLDERSKISQDLEKKNLFKTLVAILLDYKDNEITIPGVNLPIAEFIDTLVNNLERLEAITAQLDNVEQCAQSLESLVKQLDDGIETANQIKHSKDFGEEELEEMSHLQELEDLNNRLKGYREKIKELRKGSDKGRCQSGWS